MRCPPPLRPAVPKHPLPERRPCGLRALTAVPRPRLRGGGAQPRPSPVLPGAGAARAGGGERSAGGGAAPCGVISAAVGVTLGRGLRADPDGGPQWPRVGLLRAA